MFRSILSGVDETREHLTENAGSPDEETCVVVRAVEVSDCKSGQAGSTPARRSRFARSLMVKARDCGSRYAGSIPVAQPNYTVWGSANGRPSDFGSENRGSNPRPQTTFYTHGLL